ncbi:mucoidy inhibitor MuiA family protein [Polaribacter sp. Asnod6-C07]|uniref:DUF4139 domain-containing protein n=1 Tax=Polaribacter sp. Asnod6-C07 TaxID=3160582 RepID=UPI00386F27E0
MKKVLFLLICIQFSISSKAQKAREKIIKSEVKSAVIFLENAQVNREETVFLSKGENILKFTNLSPFVDSKSIQVRAKDIEIQAINFQKDYLKQIKKNPELQKLKTQLSLIVNNINSKNVDLEIVKEEVLFLKSNKSIGGNQTLTATTFKEAANYYGSKIKTLKTTEFKLKNEIRTLNLQASKIEKQINDFTSNKNFGSGEITIRLKSEQTKNTKFILSYNVDNVGWYPSYDVRVKDINSPLELVYKANLYQNSKVDWTNVKLSFSSGNPSKSNKVKEVIPYFINYGTNPPNYKNNINKVTGIVSSSGEPLPGATITIKGTTIGTTTDFDGKFSLEIPDTNSTLLINYLGFKSKEMSVNSNYINVNLEEDSNQLDEIVVVGYGTKRKGSSKNKRNIGTALTGRAAGISIRGASSIKEEKVSIINTKQVINQTTVNFEVVKPYSIKTSNKNFSIPMRIFDIASNYQYYSFPKAEQSAFLVAKITDWEKFNLLEAEANIYFEDTFVGTTLIDTRIAKKELEISLGIDKNVTISRTKEKDFTTRQFIGNKKEESRVWNYSVKNNKNEAINIIVLDQIPISMSETIKIELDTDITKGKLNTKSGEIRWNINLPSKEVKNFKLKYAVKHPKNYVINLD